ncbi:heterokaryon incompatibility protein-domain-containing protein [Ustulina deusta]|nr:heterokaryon incompatibility protein-domain-containing protein [Ustulina deusta]
MRLINTRTRELYEFFGDRIPTYAILSHTWSDREITFRDWADRAGASGEGHRKILQACKLAERQGYDYIWVDTVCIDKSSSAELTEAINSMFMWYKMAGICYAYLIAVLWAKEERLSYHLSNSRWFTRGWTLQELLAPREVEFYSENWILLGTKASLCSDISSITGIAAKYLAQNSFAVPIAEASVAERLSWLSCRRTTRTEDMAYCMLGIFDINMPLLYGEGPRAFMRLQEEIMKVSNDFSLFCWKWKLGHYGSFLSPSPSCFAGSSHFIPSQQDVRPTPYFMTNAGLSITLPVLYCCDGRRSFIWKSLSDLL